MKALKLMAFLLCLSVAAAEEIPELIEPAGALSETVVVTRGHCEFLRQVSGYVAPVSEILSFECDGTIDRICVKPGDKVSAGDVLCTLDAEDEKEAIEALETRLERLTENDRLYDEAAALKIRRLELECEGNPEKENELEETRLMLSQEDALRAYDMETLTQTIQTQKEALSQKELVAPFSGTVSYINTQSKVVRGDNRVLLLDESDLYVSTEKLTYATLADAERIYTRIGSEEYELVPDLEYARDNRSSGASYSRLRFADEAATPEVGTYLTVYYVTVSYDDVLLLPVDAVRNDGNARYVYKDEAGRHVKTAITVGTGNGIEVVVTGGLAEGDVVYVSN